MSKHADFIAGWNVGYWNGRMDALNNAPYRTRSADDPMQTALEIVETDGVSALTLAPEVAEEFVFLR
jgi:hypothetical protein